MLGEYGTQSTKEGEGKKGRARFGLSNPSLNVAEEGEHKKEGSETGQPLVDIGYRLGLDGMGKPEEASQKGDGKGISSFFSLMAGKGEDTVGDKKEEEAI